MHEIPLKMYTLSEAQRKADLEDDGNEPRRTNPWPQGRMTMNEMGYRSAPTILAGSLLQEPRQPERHSLNICNPLSRQALYSRRGTQHVINGWCYQKNRVEDICTYYIRGYAWQSTHHTQTLVWKTHQNLHRIFIWRIAPHVLCIAKEMKRLER